MTTVSVEERTAAQEVAANLTQLHGERGGSYREIDRFLQTRLGRWSPSHETIRLYHEGRIAGRINLLWVAGICAFYERPLDEVAPTLASQARAVGLIDTFVTVTDEKAAFTSQMFDGVLKCAYRGQAVDGTGMRRDFGGKSWSTGARSAGHYRRSTARTRSWGAGCSR